MPYVPTIQDLDLPTEQLLKLADEQKKWDRDHTYVIDIIKLLHGRKWGVRKQDLDDQLLEKRRADGEPIPKEFAKTVQSILNSYTSQSRVFEGAQKGPEDDLFYSPKGKGSGTWALRSDRAREWLKRKIGTELQ